jgi:hypothetical protein
MVNFRIAGYAVAATRLTLAPSASTHELSISAGHGGWVDVTCRKLGAGRVLHAWTYSMPQRRWEGDRAPTDDRHLLASIMEAVREVAARKG